MTTKKTLLGILILFIMINFFIYAIFAIGWAMVVFTPIVGPPLLAMYVILFFCAVGFLQEYFRFW